MKKYWCENEHELLCAINKAVEKEQIIKAAEKFPVGFITNGDKTWYIWERELFDAVAESEPEHEPQLTPEGFVKYVNAFCSDIKCRICDVHGSSEIIFYDGDDEDDELFIFIWDTKEILTNEFQLLNGLLIYSDALVENTYASYKSLLIHILQVVRDITEEQIEETKQILGDIKEFEEMIINK